MKPAPLAQCLVYLLVLVLVPYGEGRDPRIQWPSYLRLFDKAYTTTGIRRPLEQGIVNCAEKETKVAVAENVALLKFLYAVLVDNSNRPTEIWLGIHKAAGNDTWTELTTGLPAPYLPAKGLPAPHGTPHDARVCAFLNVTRGAWLMSAHSCVAMFHVVCEKDCSPKDSCVNMDNYCDSAVGTELICNEKRINELVQRDKVFWSVGITVVALVVIANVYTGLMQVRKRRRRRAEREEAKRVALAKLAAQRRVSDDDDDDDDEKAEETTVDIAEVVEPPPGQSVFRRGFRFLFKGRQRDDKVKVQSEGRGVMTSRGNRAGSGDVIDSASSSRGSSGGVPSGRPPVGIPSGRPSVGTHSGKASGGTHSGKPSGGISSGKASGGIPSGKPPGGVPSGRPSVGVPSDKASGGITSDRPSGWIPLPGLLGGISSDSTSGGNRQWISSRSRKNWLKLKMAVFYGPAKKSRMARQWSIYRNYKQVRQQSNFDGYRKSTKKPPDQLNFGSSRKSTPKPPDQLNFGSSRKST